MAEAGNAFGKWIRSPGVWLRLLMAGMLLLFLFKFFASLPKTLKLIATAHPGYLLLGLAIVSFGELVTIAKWQLLLRSAGQRLPFLLAAKATLIGMFYNNVLPGSVGGDVARIFVVAQHVGGKARAAAGIFMQRNTGMAGLLIVGNVSSWIWPKPLPNTSFPTLLLYPATWMAAITIAYAATNVLIVHDGLSRWIAGHVGGWRDRGQSKISRSLIQIAQKLVQLHDEVRVYYRWLALPLMVSVLSQAIDCFLVFIISRSLGMEVPFHLFLIFVPLVTVATMIPISFNGLGLREAGYLLLLGSSGVNKEAAVATSLLHYGYILLLSLGGLIWQLPDLQGRGETPETAGMLPDSK